MQHTQPCVLHRRCSYVEYQESSLVNTNSPDTAVKHTRPERNAMTHICKKKVSFHLPLHGHICTQQRMAQQAAHTVGDHLGGEARVAGEEGRLTQHGRADVHANPVVTLIGDVIPAQPRATAEGRKRGKRRDHGPGPRVMPASRNATAGFPSSSAHNRETLVPRGLDAPRPGRPSSRRPRCPICHDTGQGPHSPHVQEEARPVLRQSQQLHSPL